MRMLLHLTYVHVSDINMQPTNLPAAFLLSQGEQQEYAQEGISWSYIDFVDNQDCLDLYVGWW